MNHSFLPTLLLTLFLGSLLPVHADSLNTRIQEAVTILDLKQGSKHPVPQNLLNNCKGIAIIRLGRGGLVFGGTHGTGIVMARTKKIWGAGWSSPCAFSMSGGSFGAQIGFETRDYIFVLNTDDALKSFTSDDRLKWDATAAATAGPDHISEEASQVLDVPVYVYSRTDGAFAGATLGGTSISTDMDANRAAYGDSVSTSEILTGKVKVPQSAAKLYTLLGGK